MRLTPSASPLLMIPSSRALFSIARCVVRCAMPASRNRGQDQTSRSPRTHFPITPPAPSAVMRSGRRWPVDKLQITQAGRRRVASADFAKTMVHVIEQATVMAAQGAPLEDTFDVVVTYLAVNLLVDDNNYFELPAGKE